MTISITNTQLMSIFFSNWETLDNISKPAIIVPNQRNMPRIVIIGAGFATAMVTHCIAQTHPSSLVIVSDSHELRNTIEKNDFQKDIIVLTAVPQLEEFIIDITEDTKTKQIPKIIPAVVPCKIARYWYHALWTRPP